MNNRWEVSSVNGQKTGQEGNWTSLDQIQGYQTLLRNNVFGISFRIIPSRFEKFSDIYIQPTLFNQKEANQNNDTIRYTISEVQFSRLNPYYRMLEKSGINVNTIYEQLKERLTGRDWSWLNVQGLMEYGVVEGIRTKLIQEDNKNNNGRKNEEAFLSEPALRIMDAIDWAELELKGTDEECLDRAQSVLDIKSKFASDKKNVDDIAWEFVYKKYQKIVNEKEKTRTSGAQSILEYMKNNGFTVHDLSLALAMAQATKTGVKEAENHLINGKTAQQQRADEQTNR